MYHWTDRELTNRERARIQTFPDNYEFVGNYSSVRKQIGMAVPCQLPEVVITAVLNSLRELIIRGYQLIWRSDYDSKN